LATDGHCLDAAQEIYFPGAVGINPQREAGTMFFFTHVGHVVAILMLIVGSLLIVPGILQTGPLEAALERHFGKII
jgi:hypothetical protein